MHIYFSFDNNIEINKARQKKKKKKKEERRKRDTLSYKAVLTI